MTMNYGTAIQEVMCSPSILPEHIYSLTEPTVLRGLVSNWPLVKQSLISNNSVVDYITKSYNGEPVTAFMAKPESNGRIFYNDKLDGFNFVQSKVYLDDALNKIIKISEHLNPPTYYLGSLETKTCLNKLAQENHLTLNYSDARQSIWLGNRSVIAPHYDFPDNLACCVIGERKFTLFPPEQQSNLYVGPIDFTPAGQPISMVNIQQPDLNRYPKFEKAMQSARTATLQPGDAIFIPSMWWHSVESLSTLNGLVNYWWRTTPNYLGVPSHSLLHAILSIKYLPKEQRAAWKNIFNDYVFDQPEDFYNHLPKHIKHQQSNITDLTAHKIRAHLINKLK